MPEKKNGQGAHAEERELIEQIKKKARTRKILAARSLAERIQILPDGTRVFLRFDRTQRIEHQTLIGSFTVLGVTGLVQRYSRWQMIGFLINTMGGVETVRTLHHLAAIILAVVSIYHIFNILQIWFVKREQGAMWPRFKDLKDLIDIFKYNLGLAKKRPEHDRFSIEEKMEYWALLWGCAVMGLTGFIQWFPIQFTQILPGEIVPVSRTIHSWEAVLAVLAILTWHVYHTLIKEKNKSIFTGLMTEEEMLASHPLEYRRILAAYEFLEKRDQGKPQDLQAELGDSPVKELQLAE